MKSKLDPMRQGLLIYSGLPRSRLNLSAAGLSVEVSEGNDVLAFMQSTERQPVKLSLNAGLHDLRFDFTVEFDPIRSVHVQLELSRGDWIVARCVSAEGRNLNHRRPLDQVIFSNPDGSVRP
jgi:hypothetical protein